MQVILRVQMTSTPMPRSYWGKESSPAQSPWRWWFDIPSWEKTTQSLKIHLPAEQFQIWETITCGRRGTTESMKSKLSLPVSFSVFVSRMQECKVKLHNSSLYCAATAVGKWSSCHSQDKPASSATNDKDAVMEVIQACPQCGLESIGDEKFKYFFQHVLLNGSIYNEAGKSGVC